MSESITSGLTQYYRCPDAYDRFGMKGALPSTSGYFRFGQASICYGSYHRQKPSLNSVETLQDALLETLIENGTVYLPFNPAQVIANLGVKLTSMSGGAAQCLHLRTVLLVSPGFTGQYSQAFAKGLSRRLENLPFPRWPVIFPLIICWSLMLQSLRASGEERIPFIWFWPDGCSSCAIMTHDVETQAGYGFVQP